MLFLLYFLKTKYSLSEHKTHISKTLENMKLSQGLYLINYGVQFHKQLIPYHRQVGFKYLDPICLGSQTKRQFHTCFITLLGQNTFWLLYVYLWLLQALAWSVSIERILWPWVPTLARPPRPSSQPSPAPKRSFLLHARYNNDTQPLLSTQWKFQFSKIITPYQKFRANVLAFPTGWWGKCIFWTHSTFLH